MKCTLLVISLTIGSIAGTTSAQVANDSPRAQWFTGTLEAPSPAFQGGGDRSRALCHLSAQHGRV